MTKNRTRQSTRRQAKKLIQAAILNGLSRDIDQFLEEQRQQMALDLTDQASVLNAGYEEQSAPHSRYGISTGCSPTTSCRPADL